MSFHPFPTITPTQFSPRRSSLGDATVFQSECKSILARMLDAVPQNVTLTDEITLLPAKVNNAQLTFEKNQMVFKSIFRARPVSIFFHTLGTNRYSL